MWGPSDREIIGSILFLLAVGALFGALGYKGCSYVYDHVEIRWQP